MKSTVFEKIMKHLELLESVTLKDKQMIFMQNLLNCDGVVLEEDLNISLMA